MSEFGNFNSPGERFVEDSILRGIFGPCFLVQALWCGVNLSVGIKSIFDRQNQIQTKNRWRVQDSKHQACVSIHDYVYREKVLKLCTFSRKNVKKKSTNPVLNDQLDVTAVSIL